MNHDRRTRQIGKQSNTTQVNNRNTNPVDPVAHTQNHIQTKPNIQEPKKKKTQKPFDRKSKIPNNNMSNIWSFWQK